MSTFTRKMSDLIQEGFDFGLTPEDYPIFDEVYRDDLNKKILDHYWNYEIGHETESMFRFALNRKMRENMPYYNQLYESELIQFEALDTANLREQVNNTNQITDTNDATSNNNNTTDGKSRVVSSETPQVMLSPNEDYASGATDSISESNVSADGTSHSTNVTDGSGTIDRTVTGSNGIPISDLLIRYRQTFMNIDMLVIESLATLFMQIWDNGDEFSATEGYSYGASFGYFPFSY